jgi:hypothetical protein
MKVLQPSEHPDWLLVIGTINAWEDNQALTLVVT